MIRLSNPNNVRTSINQIKPKYRSLKKESKKSKELTPLEEIFNNVVKDYEDQKNEFESRLHIGNQKIYMFGEPHSGTKCNGEPQNFYKLRKKCLEKGELFTDPQFPTTNESLFTELVEGKTIVWKRPKEITKNPQFTIDGISRFDVVQGFLGDCWLLASIASLTMNKQVFDVVVPPDQSYSDEIYAGIFHFRFWYFGKWVDVVIDDLLPTINGKLMYVVSTEQDEYWTSLLEKAYAKLYKTYANLEGGLMNEALIDFTGGISETYMIFQEDCRPPDLFNIMLQAYERNSLLCCSINPSTNIREAKTDVGLVEGHAYTISCVRNMKIQNNDSYEIIPMVRIRNPWGCDIEWNGAFSDGSKEWNMIPKNEKEKIGLTFAADGEFWMKFDDFQYHFSVVDLCHVEPIASYDQEDLLQADKKKWDIHTFEGSWIKGTTAGGNVEFPATFWRNQQYCITLEEPDDGNTKLCTILIFLVQKFKRLKEEDPDSIGYYIYHIPNPTQSPKPLNYYFFRSNNYVGKGEHVYLRQMSGRHKFPCGTYCIIPTTYFDNIEGEFILQVYTEKKSDMVENDEQIGLGDLDDRILKHDREVAEVCCCTSKVNLNDENDIIRKLFLKVAGDDGEIDWMELKHVLDFTMRKELGQACFSKDICRSMIAMLDANFSGKLDFEEFKILWENICTWRSVFKLYDKRNTNKLGQFQLREALNSAGYRVNNHILNILIHRYGNREGEITFDDFIMCAIRLKTMIDLFISKDQDKTGHASYIIEDWINITVYS